MNCTISIPDRLDTFNYLAGMAKKQCDAPHDYIPTRLGASDAVITAWGMARMIFFMHPEFAPNLYSWNMKTNSN